MFSHIVFVVLLLSSCSVLSLRTIYVNQRSGKDDESCWTQGEKMPCLTLAFALEGAQMVDSSVISLSEGTYSLPDNDSLTTFTNKNQFEINGEVSGSVLIDCEDKAGLSFYYSTNISLSNVTLTGCGAVHNSTSSSLHDNNTEPMKYLQFQAAVYFLFCSDVYLDHIVVTHSNGTGVVFYSTVGQNFINSSNFTFNKAPDGNPGGGGVAVEFLYCIPGDVNCNDSEGSHIPYNYTTGGYYLFINCQFIGNNGSTSDFTSDSFIVPHANYNVALGRGGGLSVLYKGNVTGVLVTISQCKFENNMAIWGGGMLIEFQDFAQDNTVVVQETNFINNTCSFNPCTYQGTGGGGARVQFAGYGSDVKNNTIEFVGTTFNNNSAYFGGGVSFFTFPEFNNKLPSNAIYFWDCHWMNNSARLGSAIDLSVWHLYSTVTGSLVIKPEFRNCLFVSNSIKYTTAAGTSAGIGTVYSDSVPIQFRDEAYFIDNEGSAIASLDAEVQFGSKSNTTIIGNRGKVGAGITLFNKAFLNLNESCSLKFINNSAHLHGGGIYWESIGDHQLISSRNCFIRYNDVTIDPSEWPVYLLFDNNKANISGHAIYATTIIGCLWGGQASGKLVNPHQEYFDVFCWNPSIWDYGNHSCNDPHVIATAPGYYSDNMGGVMCGSDLSNSTYSTSVVPGNVSVLPVTMLDDRFNPVPNNSLVFSVFVNNTNDYSNITYMTYENISYWGIPSDTLDLHVATTQPRVITSKIYTRILECPPGFIWKKESLVCESGLYPYMLTYSNLTAAIQFGYWMGHYYSSSSNESRSLLVGQCTYCPWNPQRNHANYLNLPSRNEELDDFFCGGLHRTGTTCSLCKPGFGVAVNSDQFKCIKCDSETSHYSWLLYIIVEYVPLTILLIIIIIFNISVTSGPANAFIFFAQIVSTTFGVDADGLINYESLTSAAPILKQIYTTLYGIWNLKFFTAIDYNGWLFCLGPHITSLHIMTFKFIAAFYPLLVIGIVSIIVNLYHNNYRVIVCIFRPLHQLSARCLRHLNLNRSLMDTFATFVILSYVKFAVTASVLLYPNRLQDHGSNSKIVSKFNGDYEYFSWDYAPYLAISSLVLIMCTVMPFILLLYSIKPCYRCLEYVQCQHCLPGEKFNYFLNSFHQCFKDGTEGGHDRRYFAALYFFFKLLLILTYVFGLDWTKQYVLQQIICTIGLFLVSSLQPYKKTLYNVLDAGMFSLLACINIITMYNRYLEAINQSLSHFSYGCQIILIFIPLFYLTGYIIYFISKNCWKKWKGNFPHAENRRNLDEFSFGGFMNDVTTEGRFQNNTYHGPLTPDDLTYDAEENNYVVDPGHHTVQIEQKETSFRPRRARERATEPLLTRQSIRHDGYESINDDQ